MIYVVVSLPLLLKKDRGLVLSSLRILQCMGSLSFDWVGTDKGAGGDVGVKVGDG